MFEKELKLITLTTRDGKKKRVNPYHIVDYVNQVIEVRNFDHNDVEQVPSRYDGCFMHLSNGGNLPVMENAQEVDAILEEAGVKIVRG